MRNSMMQEMEVQGKETMRTAQLPKQRSLTRTKIYSNIQLNTFSAVGKKNKWKARFCAVEHLGFYKELGCFSKIDEKGYKVEGRESKINTVSLSLSNPLSFLFIISSG
uniref:Uncharacterized protein n=1 Tax=Sphaerodactylus townsendi TaxID=933632 RepID=A0ACB8FY37_9SAUR